MANDLKTKNSTVDLGDKIAVYDTLGWSIIARCAENDPRLTEALAKFKKNFRVVSEDRILADPNEDFTNGVSFISLIERISDGKIFGHVYVEDMTEDGFLHISPNGEAHGISYEWDYDYYPKVYVFTPVKSFTVTGYELDVEGQ